MDLFLPTYGQDSLLLELVLIFVVVLVIVLLRKLLLTKAVALAVDRQEAVVYIRNQIFSTKIKGQETLVMDTDIGKNKAKDYNTIQWN